MHFLLDQAPCFQMFLLVVRAVEAIMTTKTTTTTTTTTTRTNLNAEQNEDGPEDRLNSLRGTHVAEHLEEIAEGQ